MITSSLAFAVAALAAGDTRLQPALDRLKVEAAKALLQPSLSVTLKTRLPPSGDKHDYLSLAPYWWPDPAKPDGLPFLRRDGEVNPESRHEDADDNRMRRMASSVETLALAWHFTRDTRFAVHAALLLKTWFLDPATRMNPHLEYGQGIPGRCDGRGIGIIDTHSLPSMLEAVERLRNSPAWPEADHAALQAWFRDYLRWLLTSPKGLEEARQHNNHGTWYDVQVAAFALFSGDRETALRTLRAVRVRRIETQIRPDGSQPHELSRTRSLDYSVMNLRAFFALAEMGEALGVDLWHAPEGDPRGLRAALDYLAPFADPAKPWPGKQIKEANRAVLLPLLLQGARIYGKAYEEAAARLPAEESRPHRARLLYHPPPPPAS